MKLFSSPLSGRKMKVMTNELNFGIFIVFACFRIGKRDFIRALCPSTGLDVNRMAQLPVCGKTFKF